MRYVCPACQRSFDEPGFCPYDRSNLIAPTSAADKQTLPSEVMPAQGDPRASHKTDVEHRRGTFPLTPSAPAAAAGEITSPRGPSSQLPTFRAVSASDDTGAARDAFRTPTESEYDRLVGQTLDGRYYVEKKIGEGGMGVVFAARHAVIERPLAIKVLKREVMRDTATIKRFVQEAKAASRIGHPNIVDVTDFGTTPDGMTYSVMEYVDRQTLGRRDHAPPHRSRRCARSGSPRRSRARSAPRTTRASSTAISSPRTCS